jgi:peptidoglycan/xylan/chitin deacetylase (PgdA/CDA1 family)
VVCTLTFDDGPDPRWTARILDALATARVRATFFVLAPQAAHHPRMIERTLAEGHEVQLHGAAHLRHPEHDRPTIEHDTDLALVRLAELGVRPTLWRLPWGRAAEWSQAVADERGLTIVGWDADTHDWRGDDAATMLNAVTPHLADGAVVLAHDGLGPGATRDGCDQTMALIAPLVAAARERGLRCAPMSENPTALATARAAATTSSPQRDRAARGARVPRPVRR